MNPQRNEKRKNVTELYEYKNFIMNSRHLVALVVKTNSWILAGSSNFLKLKWCWVHFCVKIMILSIIVWFFFQFYGFISIVFKKGLFFHFFNLRNFQSFSVVRNKIQKIFRKFFENFRTINVLQKFPFYKHFINIHFKSTMLWDSKTISTDNFFHYKHKLVSFSLL